MNQIMLNVLLTAENEEEDTLVFQFQNGDCKVNLNTDSCQAELKGIFSKLLYLCIENDVTLSLIIQDGYNRGLYKDVCKEYISELQRELDNIKDSIRREMAPSQNM